MALGGSIGSVRVNLGANTAAFEKAMGRAATSMQKTAAKMRSIGTRMAATVTAPLLGIATLSVKKFGQQEDALAAVKAVVRSTGGAAGFTTEKLADMASALQEVSTFGDEDILKKVTANLLTFTNIAGPEFERAQQAVLDLAARFGSDLQPQAIMVGKALNDPILGLSAMRRVGIQLTAQQEEMVRAFVDTGQVAKAQGIILDELGRQYGGQAFALAKTTKGQWLQAINALGDAMEKVGKVIAPLAARIANAIKSLSEGFQKLSPQTQRFIVVLGALAAAAGPLLIALGLMIPALVAIGGPITLIIAGIAAATAAVAAFWPEIQRAWRIFSFIVPAIYQLIKNWLGDKLEAVWNWITSKIDKVKSALKSVWEFLGGPLIANELGIAVASAKTGVAALVESVGGSEVVARLKAAGQAVKINSQALVRAALNPFYELGPKIQQAWIGAGSAAEVIAGEVSSKIASPMAQARQKVEVASAGMVEAFNLMRSHQESVLAEGQQIAEAVATPLESYQAALIRLNELLEQGAISQETYSRAAQNAAENAGATWQAQAQSISGSFNEIASNFGKSNSKIAKASKIFGAAQALIATLAGAAEALKIGFPQNIAASAAVLAKGLGLVAAIKGTTVPGFAHGGSFVVGGGGGTDSQHVAFKATPGERVTIETPEQQAGNQTTVIRIDGIHPEEFFSGDRLRILFERMNDAMRDGERLEVAT